MAIRVKMAIFLAIMQEASMGDYSVAEAKNRLPSLIDKAVEGEEVTITRHGKAIAELRAIVTPHVRPSGANYDWLRQRRLSRKPVSIGSVELLRQMYEDPEG